MTPIPASAHTASETPTDSPGAFDLVSGICPVLATPFTDTGDLDVEGFSRLVEHVLATGVSAVLQFGIASEFYKLSDAERALLQRLLLDQTRDRSEVAAIISITDHATDLAVRSARQAVDQGADILNLLPPHFASPPTEQLIGHLDAVLSATDTPVIIQYAPAQTGTSIDVRTLRDLADRHPNLRGVKVESIPSGRFITSLRQAAPAVRAVVGYAGTQMLDAAQRGAVGVQPGCSFTELYQHIWAESQAGRTHKAGTLHARLLPYISSWMQHIELIIAAEKRILAHRGLIVSSRCRAPHWPLDEQEERLIAQFLSEFADDLTPTV